MRFRDHVTLLLESRRRRLLAAAVAVIVLAAVGAVVWTTRADTAPSDDGGGSPVFECPSSVPSSAEVPAPPQVPDLDGRLVPRGTPDVIALCEFPAGGGALARSDLVGGDETPALPLLTALAAVTTSPTGSAPCPGRAATGAPVYLVGLAFEERVVWVAAPDACGGSTNGPDSTSTDLSAAIATALAAADLARSPSPGAGTSS